MRASRTSSQPILALEDLTSASSLTSLFSLLFEPSPPLRSLLVPSVLLRLTALDSPPDSYNQPIDICADVAGGWTWDQKADFLSGHPLIGEIKGLSEMSGEEQGGATPEVVLDRLAHLNELYCTVYPGLRYVTFVNGRSRAAIVPEMEGVLGLPVSPQPLLEEFPTNEPAVESEEVKGVIKHQDSEEWKRECERGLGDVWRIGRARLAGLGLK